MHLTYIYMPCISIDFKYGISWESNQEEEEEKEVVVVEEEEVKDNLFFTQGVVLKW